MRVPRQTLVIVVLLLLGISAPAKDESLQQLLDHAKSARVEDQPALYSSAAEKQLKSADQLFTAGKVDDARAAVADVVNFSDKASSAAIQSGKKLKHTEISVRRMASKLRDIKRSLAFEDQPPVQSAIDHLESLRTQLLSKMFGKGTK